MKKNNFINLDQDLKHAVKAIRLPEDSRQNIIQKLEQISTEEAVFQAEPARSPLFRYVLTGALACAVVTASVGGIVHVARMQSGDSRDILMPGEIITDSQDDFSNPGNSGNPDNSDNFKVPDMSGETRVYAIRTENMAQYFRLSDTGTAELLDSLQAILTSHAQDVQTDFMVGGQKEFMICLPSVWMEFWNDGGQYFMLMQLTGTQENPENQIYLYCLAISPEEYDNIQSRLAEPALYFDMPDTSASAVCYQSYEQEMSSYMFGEKNPPFGDISQMQERLVFLDYAPSYLIPTDEQHEQLAGLLNHAEWGQLPADDTREARVQELEQGEFFVIYFDAPEGRGRFLVRFQMSGLIVRDAEKLYYDPELVTAIRELFVPAETCYQLDPDRMSLAEMFVQMFDETPVTSQPDADPDQDLNQDLNQDAVTIQIQNEPVLIHDEKFFRNEQGGYTLESETAYLIPEERKWELSDLIAEQELQAIIGFPEFDKGETYQKFVIEFTEQDGFLTLEYDVENSQYHLIFCVKMEIPGEPVETGTYCYFPVTEEFAEAWNGLLADPGN